MYKFRNVVFEDVEQECYTNIWSSICKDCVSKYNIAENLLDKFGSGHCMVEDCENEADYYIDFPELEMLEILLEDAKEQLKNIIDDAENGVDNDGLYQIYDNRVNEIKQRIEKILNKEG